MASKREGKIFIISGPSGAGKGTLISEAVKELDDIEVSVSVTTRNIRKGESPGKSYYFVSDEEFDKKIKEDEFLEWAKVHSNRYGTLKKLVRNLLQSGKDLILELDVQGAISVKEKIPNSILIFILPPSDRELKKRLLERDTENQGDVGVRLRTAESELKFQNIYDYKIVNADLSQAKAELIGIINSIRKKD
ncbi:MAG: guanylate kinase [Actinomycetota bacterium]|nr:guanylate kinase [Actinomycetota bacterium]